MTGHGFVAAERWYINHRYATGDTQLAVVLMVADLGDGLPKVWWQLRDIFYRLGYSHNAEMHRWLKQSRQKMSAVLDEFDVPESHLRQSTKQYMARSRGVGVELCHNVIQREHHDEVMVSSAYMLAFLLHNTMCRKKEVSAAALEMLRGLLTLLGEVPVVLNGGEDLPRCAVRAGAACRHEKALEAHMTRLFGEGWRASNAADMLVHLRSHSSCVSHVRWRYQTFWQGVELLDLLLGSGLVSNDPAGMPVLAGTSKCRRLSAALQAGSRLGVEKDSRGVRRLAKGAKRTTSVYLAERLLMAKYVYHNAAMLEKQNQLSICVDCSSVSGHELLTTAVAAPAAKQNMWLPPQDLLSFVFNMQL